MGKEQGIWDVRGIITINMSAGQTIKIIKAGNKWNGEVKTNKIKQARNDVGRWTKLDG